jgi:predicted alpha/beta superfamily hydrolase
MKKNVALFIFSCFFSLTIFAQDSAVLLSEKPFVLGTIHEIKSSVLGEKRTINVYLPVGYNQNDSVSYPVIYLLDGSADEDFIHIAGLVQFLNFPWVNKLPNSILVGIANVDRRRDFTFPTTIEKDKKDFPTTGGSAKFIQFLESELQPFIERTYKTTATKTIVGQSLGGLLATEILFKKPHLFNKYIIVSPSLWWNNESLLQVPPRFLNAPTNSPISVYVANGKEGKIMEADTKRLVDIVSKAGNIKVAFEYFTDENHASILHNAAYKGFEAVNKVEDEEKIQKN